MKTTILLKLCLFNILLAFAVAFLFLATICLAASDNKSPTLVALQCLIDGDNRQGLKIKEKMDAAYEKVFNLIVINNYKKFKKNFYIFNLSNKKQYSNFQVLEELSKIMKIKPKYEIKQINKKESITQIIKSGDDISKFINYKPKYLDLKKILKTNIKWFKKIY